MTTSFRVQRILVPTDFSPASDAAVTAAVGMAEVFGARVELAHIWAPPTMTALDFAFIPSASEIAGYTERLEKLLAEAARKTGLPATRLDRHLVQGEAWSTIVELAKEKQCDLIVMGTHGRSGLPHFVMGSVAERVARASTIPVLIVPSAR